MGGWFSTHHTIPMSEPIRYCLCSDDSGHKYFIPVNQVEDFYAWVVSFEEVYADLGYEGPDFEANRIDGRFTFTDPKNG